MVRNCFCILSVFIVLCNCTAENETTGVHPDQEKLPGEDEITYTFDVDGAEKYALNIFFPGSTGRQSGGTSITSVQLPVYYEDPDVIHIDKRNRIYIINRASNGVDVYNTSGELLKQIGGSGFGPGELQHIVTFHMNELGTKLYLLDSQKVEVFVYRDDHFQHDTSFYTGYQLSYDLCELDGSLYVSGYGFHRQDSEAIVNEETDVFELTRFLGPILRFDTNNYEIRQELGYSIDSFSGVAVTSGMLSETFLSCHEETNTIIGLLRHFPYVFGYNTKGGVEWVSKLKGMIGTRIEEFEEPDGRPGAYFYANEDVYHRYFRFTDSYGKYALIHMFLSPPNENFARRGHREVDILSEIKTLLIDSETGKIVQLEDQERKLEAVYDNVVINSSFDQTDMVYTIYIDTPGPQHNGPIHGHEIE